MSEQQELSYFQQRLARIGINSPEQYTITPVRGEFVQPDEKGQYPNLEWKLFTEDKEGNIVIHYPNLNGGRAQYRIKDDKWSKPYTATRLKKPKDDRKYNFPKNSGSMPFLPPKLIDKYQRGEKVKVLTLTEGAFKAFAGSLNGIDIIGLGSINHMKDAHTGGLHEDVLEIIKKCEVEKLIWLVDGDCNDLSKKFGTKQDEEPDLYQRINLFFKSAAALKQFTDHLENVEKWFVHPLTYQLEGNPKALDDMLELMPDQRELIAKDLLNFSKKGATTFFYKINISYSLNEVRRYLNLHDVNAFYHAHLERYPTLKDSDFVWNGTKYKYNAEKNECQVIIPGDAKNYFRVGDQYHEFVNIPNKYDQIERVFHPRQRSTIVEDHGKNIMRHVPKYKAFCNVPNHVNFQPVIHNCFNVYSPIEHTPEEGEITTTIEYLKHVFGTGTIHWKDPKTGEKHQVNELDLGLDYLQLLYTRPTQILPILCLVSREQGTGKTTLAKWLKLIFTANVAIVGNADLANDFNGPWATKLLIICDETKIDKQHVVEKVKNLSTADKVFMNKKGKDQVEIDFFGKFIFLTNNEENFVYASEDDVRYWIRKVPPAQKLNINILAEMQDEIPAFLHFLQTRQLKLPERHRAWFDPELIKTEALKKVIRYSAPALEKEIRSQLRDMFMDFGVDEIMMTVMDMCKEWFGKKYEQKYIHEMLQDRMKVEQYHHYIFRGTKYNTVEDVIRYIGEANWTTEVVAELQKKSVAIRYSYPMWRESGDPGNNETKRYDIKKIGRPYVFKVEHFLSAEEIKTREIDAETMRINELQKIDNTSTPSLNQEELPF